MTVASSPPTAAPSAGPSSATIRPSAPRADVGAVGPGPPPNFSDATEKERQRAVVADACMDRTTAVTNPADIVVLLFDALIGEVTLTERVRAACPDARIVAVTLDAPVFERLERRAAADPSLWVGFGCYYGVLDRLAPLVGFWGGFDVVNADVHGGFDRGARGLLAWLMERRLLRPNAALSFAASVRYDQTQMGSRAAAISHVADGLHALGQRPGPTPQQKRASDRLPTGRRRPFGGDGPLHVPHDGVLSGTRGGEGRRGPTGMTTAVRRTSRTTILFAATPIVFLDEIQRHFV